MIEVLASECLVMAVDCAHGWLHVNADWVVLEPVDADDAPTPPGNPSHPVLLTNLANHVQPLIRYDLGDSVLARPDPPPALRRLSCRATEQARTQNLPRLPRASRCGGASARAGP